MEKDGMSVLKKTEADEENGHKAGDKQLLTVKNILASEPAAENARAFRPTVGFSFPSIRILPTSAPYGCSRPSRQIAILHSIWRFRISSTSSIFTLSAVHQKKYIGSLSAYCGVVSAACGAACGICYMLGYPYEVVCETITNTIATVGGMVCDGAKSSCAAKISTALQTALLGMKMGLHDRAFQPGEGLVEDDVEETIRSIGRMGRDGMHSTDLEILNIMLGN